MACNITLDIRGLWISSSQKENNDDLFSFIEISPSSPTDLVIYGTLTITKVGDSSPVLVENYGYRPPSKNPSGTKGLIGAGFLSCNYFSLPKCMLREGDKLAINAFATVQSPDGSRTKVSATTVEVILQRRDKTATIDATQNIGVNSQLDKNLNYENSGNEQNSPPYIKFLDAEALLILKEDSEPMLLVYQQLVSTIPDYTLTSTSTRIKNTNSSYALFQAFTNGYYAPVAPVKDISGIKGVAFECAYKFPAGSIVTGDELEFLSYGNAVANDGSVIGVVTETITVKVRLG